MAEEQKMAEIAAETRRILQPLTGGRPKLSSRLLARPPFSFIQAVHESLRENTGFARNLFTPEESDPESLQDKKGKLVYLVKLLVCVTVATDMPIDVIVSPVNVVTGKKPEATNYMLQQMGLAAAMGSEASAQAVHTTNAEEVSVWHQRSLMKRKMLIRLAAHMKGAAVRRKLRRESSQKTIEDAAATDGTGADQVGPMTRPSYDSDGAGAGAGAEGNEEGETELQVVGASENEGDKTGERKSQSQSDESGSNESENESSEIHRERGNEGENNGGAATVYREKARHGKLALRQMEAKFKEREMELNAREERVKRTAVLLRREKQRLAVKRDQDQKKVYAQMKRERQHVAKLKRELAERIQQLTKKRVEPEEGSSSPGDAAATLQRSAKGKGTEAKGKAYAVSGKRDMMRKSKVASPAAADCTAWAEEMEEECWMKKFHDGFLSAYSAAGGNPAERPASGSLPGSGQHNRAPELGFSTYGLPNQTVANTTWAIQPSLPQQQVLPVIAKLTKRSNKPHHPKPGRRKRPRAQNNRPREQAEPKTSADALLEQQGKNRAEDSSYLLESGSLGGLDMSSFSSFLESRDQRATVAAEAGNTSSELQGCLSGPENVAAWLQGAQSQALERKRKVKKGVRRRRKSGEGTGDDGIAGDYDSGGDADGDGDAGMSELSTEEFYRALAKLGVRMAREKVRVQDVLQQHLRSLPRVREAAFPGCPGSPAVTVHKLSLADMRDALQAFGGLSPEELTVVCKHVTLWPKNSRGGIDIDLLCRSLKRGLYTYQDEYADQEPRAHYFTKQKGAARAETASWLKGFDKRLEKAMKEMALGSLL